MPALVPILAAAIAPDASWVVTVAQDGTVRALTAVLEGDTLYPLRAVDLPPVGRIDGGQPVAVAVSGRPLRVLWAAAETLELYEPCGDGRLSRSVLRVPAPILALALAPSGNLAVVAFGDGTLRSLQLPSLELGPVLATEAVAGGRLASPIAIASDEGPVVAILADGTIRRYDLKTGSSDIVGAAADARFVAVTPDGRWVITAGPDGGINSRYQGWPLYSFRFGRIITAIAVDRSGRILACTATGAAWLLDQAGGQPICLLTVEPPLFEDYFMAGALPVRRDSLSRVIVDDDVRFTVYRPQALSPGVWASLLVFAHKTTLLKEPGRAPVDPNALVEERARVHFGAATPRPVSADARHELTRGAKLRIMPDLPGLQCNPAEAEIGWWEPVHEVMFRLLAEPGLAGTVVRGAIRIWCGPLLLGEVSLAIGVASGGGVSGGGVSGGGAMEPAQVTDSAPRYRKIFPSYSHRDGALVAAFAQAASALGDQYLQDVLTLRAGERWESRLRQLIEDADVFQLFWSSNSMYSSYCRDEWEHALALRRPAFVRPLYWEEPLPEDAGQGLPPAALRELHFVKVALSKFAIPPSAVRSRGAEQPPEMLSAPERSPRPSPAAWAPSPGGGGGGYPRTAPVLAPASAERSRPAMHAGRRRLVLVAAVLIFVLIVVVDVLLITFHVL